MHKKGLSSKCVRKIFLFFSRAAPPPHPPWLLSHWSSQAIPNRTEPQPRCLWGPRGPTCPRLHLVVHNRVFPQESTRGQDNTLRVEEPGWWWCWGVEGRGAGGGCFPLLEVLELYPVPQLVNINPSAPFLFLTDVASRHCIVLLA